ncbi:MAG: EAL domain-containing protein [Acutalibacteraceae bacterium]
MDGEKEQNLRQQEALPAAVRGNRKKVLRPLELLYQQIYDLQQNEIHGFEAQLRINDPKLGTLLPSVFVPIAEKSNRIVELGKRSFVEASDMVRRQAQKGRTVRRLFMTVSPKYLLKSYFLDNVRTQLEKASMTPEQMCIQISARDLSEPYDGIEKAVAGLHDAGMRSVLVDWGEHTLSPVMLSAIPFQYVKIDASVTAAAAEDERLRESVVAMAELAEKWRMRLIASGVAEKAQADTMQELGCSLMQGPYFGEWEREDRMV